MLSARCPSLQRTQGGSRGFEGERRSGRRIGPLGCEPGGEAGRPYDLPGSAARTGVATLTDMRVVAMSGIAMSPIAILLVGVQRLTLVLHESKTLGFVPEYGSPGCTIRAPAARGPTASSSFRARASRPEECSFTKASLDTAEKGALERLTE